MILSPPVTNTCLPQVMAIAILMDAHKMMATVILMTLVTEMMTDLILK